ncbi:MAG TPA: lytic transglycosylase domain-containing protein [Flavitalea sp.]|nr:lytic transglycosylase domain-containing protein [Flavitalea sp.]
MMMKRIFLVFCTVSLCILGTASASDSTKTPSPAQVFTIPVNVEEEVEAVFDNKAITSSTIRLNPRAKRFVDDYTTKNRKSVIGIKDKGLVYLNMIDNIFTLHGLPTELKYLAIIESRLNSRAVSHVGAVGPWQFMPGTARDYGLVVTTRRDERKDYVKSTHAAARYLKYLYNEFGDWLLVLAAYNGGPGYVYNAMKKSKSRNFWDLQYFLPEESRNHVKRFISTHYILEGQGSITTLTKAEATEQIGSLAGYLLNRSLTAKELNDARTTTISGKYRAVLVAKYVNMDDNEFNRYNPKFDKMMDAENIYEMKLPAESMDKFVANKYQILNESVQLLLNESNNFTAIELNKKNQTTAIK